MNDQVLDSCTYHADGVVVLRNLLTAAELEQLTAALNFAESNPSPMSSNLAPGEGRQFFNDFNTWRKNPHISQLLSNTRLLSRGKEIAGTGKIRLFHDHILIKRGMSPATPWHQDRPYYFVEGPKNYSIWMSPDSVAAEEGLAFLAGTHLLKRMFLPVNFKDGTVMDGPSEMEILSEAVLAELCKTHHEVGFDLLPGDALMFDNRIVHMARRSDRAVDRRALSIRFLGEEARLTWNGVNQTPPFHRMGLIFKEGDLPRDPWFPGLPLNVS